MRTFGFMLLICLPATAFAQDSNSVNGYFRKDGTYVQPHHRTNPDNNVNNNWSTQGNVNPYTGKSGTVDPDAPSNDYLGSRDRPRSNNYLRR